MAAELFIEPSCSQWVELVRQSRSAHTALFGKTLCEWRSDVRRELGLAADRRIVATGHQTLLWHPGILAKYLAVHAFAEVHGCATANLIVDQHADGFGTYEIPVRRRDGSLATQRIELTVPQPGVPMGLHDAFAPKRARGDWVAALPSVERGVQQIHDAVSAHRDAPNAALQMARALNDLMRPWVDPMPAVTATSLVQSSLGRALIEEMVRDPHNAAELYNKAVSAVPEAGIGPLLVRDDYVELPLWRIRNGQRLHAYDNDAEAWLAGEADFELMPRALFMTALIRLAMCDLFVHGIGGARYDRAMELWLDGWLGVMPAPKAVATADVRLPLIDDAPAPDVEAARQAYRSLWHDPADGDARPSAAKQQWLEQVEAAPPRSPKRRTLFYDMHEALQRLRDERSAAIEAARQKLETAEAHRRDREIAQRRDWAFALYPDELIDELASSVTDALGCEKQVLARR